MCDVLAPFVARGERVVVVYGHDQLVDEPGVVLGVVRPDDPGLGGGVDVAEEQIGEGPGGMGQLLGIELMKPPVLGRDEPRRLGRLAEGAGRRGDVVPEAVQRIGQIRACS